MEVWKSIPGFSRYEASSKGRLRSLNYKNSGRRVVLKPVLSSGYYKIMLLGNKGYKTWNIHKFISLAFHGPCPKGMEVNHINGVKIDNRSINLEYVTHSQNVKHAFDNGLGLPKRGELNGMSKVTIENVLQIRKQALTGRFYGRKELADKFGITEAHVKDIVNRKCWAHVG